MHQLMAATLETVIGEIQQHPGRRAATNGFSKRPRWPMIVLRTPKGWTGPKEVDGKRDEGYWRSHQVPMGEMRGNPEHVRILEDMDEELSARGAVRRRTARSSANSPRSRRRARGA